MACNKELAPVVSTRSYRSQQQRTHSNEILSVLRWKWLSPGDLCQCIIDPMDLLLAQHERSQLVEVVLSDAMVAFNKKADTSGEILSIQFRTRQTGSYDKYMQPGDKKSIGSFCWCLALTRVLVSFHHMRVHVEKMLCKNEPDEQLFAS